MRGIRGAAQVLAGGSKPDDYLSRVLKYIPAEIVALYVSAGGVVPKDHPHKFVILWTILILCGIATPIYMFVFARDEVTKKPIWKQIVVATIAFPVWAFALGGPFIDLAWYEPFIGSLVLMFVTFVLGAMKP
jgi:hypothetical protein